jgi:putative aminopeptidase FrvX
MKGYVIRPFEQNRALVEAAMQALEALEQVRLSRVYVGITPREEVAAIAALRQALEAKA